MPHARVTGFSKERPTGLFSNISQLIVATFPLYFHRILSFPLLLSSRLPVRGFYKENSAEKKGKNLSGIGEMGKLDKSWEKVGSR